ncbi:MAG: nucleoside triphosphate pyrophosphohydrolase [Patescibacteria group bacterium]|jgi:predicted house-cleaning noncanonical NTP pyrophosphatase (MazG superfamily)
MKNEIIYNKLIRDRIPEIIKVDGWVSKTRVMEKDEFIKELKKKILEEAKELNEGKEHKNLIEELVDIQEIIDTILNEKKVKFSEFHKIQSKKKNERGGFKKKLFLIKTIKGLK